MQTKASEIDAELNNVLAIILGGISLVKMGKQSENSQNEWLTYAEEGCYRAAGLVRKLFHLGDNHAE